MNEKPSIISDYINITHKYISKFGPKTILLMQVGAFFEMYGLKTSNANVYRGSNIEDICNICELNISDKHIMIDGENVYMAGVRDYVLDKYLSRIVDAGYTAVIYAQTKEGKNVSRELFNIVSPGTYINFDTESSQTVSNNILCVWMSKQPDFKTKKDMIVYGVSVIDIYTGKTFLFEYQCPYSLNPTTFDELERCFSVFSPNEVIFISPFDTPTTDTILQFVGCYSRNIHLFNTEHNNLSIQKCEKQKYIREIISTFFGEDSYDTCGEFSEYALATQSFCFLLNFVGEHNSQLTKNIIIPSFKNTSTRTILANHTLKQLNVINDCVNGDYGKISSVSSFLNCCCSPMGKRLMNYQLLNPCFDELWLSNEYNIIEHTLPKQDIVDKLRCEIRSIRDIEKLLRQLVIKRLYPNSIYHLYNSISKIMSVFNICIGEPEIIKYALSDKMIDIENVSTDLLNFINQRLIIDACKDCKSINTFDTNIIREGNCNDLDNAIWKRDSDFKTLHQIKDVLNEQMRIYEKDTSGKTEYVKLHETEKSGYSLIITKKRGEKLLDLCKTAASINLGNDVSLHFDQIKLGPATSQNVSIQFHLLKQITTNLFTIHSKINKLIEREYSYFLNELETEWYNEIENLSQFVSLIDVLQSKTYVANKYNYCKPTIKTDSERSFADAKNIRHPLIEHIQTNELYVANDISIGLDYNGTLIYGTNAVGKTSIIRALGISVILAQSGMFVPCSSFEFKPYKSIYSRILGNDNLFKGLSTFAVEMSELRIILKMADEFSLVLGDEVCSGTETESALSIFVASLMRLSHRKSSFLFATHFHEILKYDEIKNMSDLRIAHMSVSYDAEKDSLIYDRKLKDGPGNRMYGLEVCKSLRLDNEFMISAYELRKKYFPVNKGILDRNTSSYNSNKIKGLCELCKTEEAIDTHHLLHQQNADINGRIENNHKNHKANLMSLCKKCHDSIHSGDNIEYKRKKTTDGYIIIPK
jgi:DNA mismatch repair protein MutS